MEIDYKKPFVADTYVGQSHLRDIGTQMKRIGRILERNGINIEDIHTQFDEGSLEPSLASVNLYLEAVGLAQEQH